VKACFVLCAGLTDYRLNNLSSYILFYILLKIESKYM